MAISYTKTSWVNGQAPALNANNLNKIENGIYNATTEVNGKYSKPSGGIPSSDMASAVQSALTLANSSMQIDLLWTNASPTSTFGAQSLTLSLSGYDWIEIEYISKVGSNLQFKNTCRFSNVSGTNTGGMLIAGDMNSTDNLVQCTHRNVTITSTGLSFEDGYYFSKDTQGTNTSNPRYCVPYKIYGVKG